MADMRDYSTKEAITIRSGSEPVSELSDEDLSHEDSQFPPVDRGVGAWMFLVASFVIEGLVWGYASSFGVFQEYYQTHAPFEGSGNIAIIGTCATGLAYFLTPFVIGLMIAWPRIQCWLSTIGMVMMCLSLAASSYATNVTHLALSQGVLYGVGGCLAFTPAIIFTTEWFVKRRGFAFGLVWGGSGLTGMVFPIAIQALLDRYGWETTLRVSSVGLFILGGPFLFFLKPRIPTRTSTRRSLNLKFQFNRVYIIYQLANIIEALGYFLPAVFLPSHAAAIGTHGILASLTVVLFNFTTVIGCAIMGYMTDRYHVTNCIMVSTVGAIVSVFLVWGLSTNIGVLFLFSSLYGLFAGAFSSTWSVVAREVEKSEPSADLSMVFSFLEAGRGIGNILSGPLSSALINGHPWQGTVGGAYGSGYGVLIVFTGSTALLGGLSLFARMIKWV
ncbi:hypothetical protein SI65_09911 [Aspergillus cristatus]|uniref:Major facilitator superfamily (MFS) profile domain-containing protein n=1 Tax=Aspergillus cristatus TaxID=573508 RepID=A0A1E3B1B7_ASPCR|nr:hypothetical protein SI65_09911 [Aspergillus cristatus]